MKKIIYLITAYFIFLSCQKKDDTTINNISFDFTGANKDTHIEIRRTVDNQNASVLVYSKTFEESLDENNSKWHETKDTTFYITITSFNKLTRLLPSLEKIDTEKAFLRGLDGSVYRIEFGAKGKNQVYVFWSPNYDTKKRGLEEFINVSNEIFKTANLKKEDVFGIISNKSSQ